MTTAVAGARRGVVAFVALTLFAALCVSCAGDTQDETSAPSDDDAVDDDIEDDDSIDDDAADDDTWPPLPGHDRPEADAAFGSIYDALDWSPMTPSLINAFGVSSHMAGGGPDAFREFELDKLVDAGLSRVRRDFYWSTIEPADDNWNWSDTDTLADAAQARDLDYDALLVYGVDWAMPGGSPSEIPPEKYGDFAGQVAGRYCDKIRHYEIWNEENMGFRFWPPEEDPDHYGKLLKAAYSAIDESCYSATVVFGGMASFDFLRGIYSFFSRVAEYHPDICDYFDAVAIHPYTIAQHSAPEREILIGDFGYPDIPGQIADIRERLADAGCPDKPIWWTEFGWPSVYIGDNLQANYLARGILLGAAFPPTEDYFGLFTWSADPDPAVREAKPVYAAYKTLVDMIGTSHYAGDLAGVLGLPDDVFAPAFIDTCHLVVALWDGRLSGAPVTATLPWPDEAVGVEVIAQDGETLRATRGPAAISVPIESSVTYVSFLTCVD